MTQGLIVFLIVMFGLFWLYAKKYIVDKASNLAKKEDIGEITREIEKVKHEFNLQNNLLNVKLQQIVSNSIEHANEERNAIIKFYETYSKWINSGLLDIELFKYHRNNIEELKSKMRSLDDLYFATRMAQDKIGLIVDHSEVNRLSMELVTETLKFNHLILPKLYELEVNLSSEKRVADLFFALANKTPLPPLAEKLANDQQDIIKARDSITKEILKLKTEGYSAVLPFISAFTSGVKKFLREKKQ